MVDPALVDGTTEGPPGSRARSANGPALSPASRRAHTRRAAGGFTLEVVGRSAPCSAGSHRDSPADGATPCARTLPADDLLDRLAAALREVRGYVPDRFWWDAGAADALLEYQAKHEG